MSENLPLKQVAYETLKRKIITCEILPGSLLTEDMLCEELNASRTPVRDAVSRLEQENLVSIMPKKGIRVNRVSMNNIRELFEVRCLLEPAAVLKYGNRITDEVYARYTRQFLRKNLSSDELYRVDDEFHQMFITASDNRYFRTVYAMIADQVQRYRDRAVSAVFFHRVADGFCTGLLLFDRAVHKINCAAHIGIGSFRPLQDRTGVQQFVDADGGFDLPRTVHVESSLTVVILISGLQDGSHWN